MQGNSSEGWRRGNCLREDGVQGNSLRGVEEGELLRGGGAG